MQDVVPIVGRIREKLAKCADSDILGRDEIDQKYLCIMQFYSQGMMKSQLGNSNSFHPIYNTHRILVFFPSNILRQSQENTPVSAIGVQDGGDYSGEWYDANRICL